jgi:hypothetical protein
MDSLDAQVSAMFNHVVLYRTNPKNPQAVQQITDNAQRYLANIPGIHAFSVRPYHDSGRAVAGYKFDVGMNFIFDNKAAAEVYMKHPDHLKFVDFVLNGWMLEGSTADDPKKEFMDHILNGAKGSERKWVRNPNVAESAIVWDGEQVYDF